MKFEEHKSDDSNFNDEEKMQLRLIYLPHIQETFLKKIEYFESDFVVNLLQISIIAILNYLEKILETE